MSSESLSRGVEGVARGSRVRGLSLKSQNAADEDNAGGGTPTSLPPATILKSAALFLFAGLCEIGGGYLVWQWLRNGRGLAMGAIGGVVLFLYGVIPTFQPQHFSRVYAAYGGVFVALSLAWGWILDGQRPDRFDLLGGLLCLLGVGVIMYAPRP